MASTYERRTVLFADICGSVPLYERLGDEQASRCVRQALDTLQRHVEAASGRVIQRIGDEILCLFATPDDALDAARAMQSSIEGGEAGNEPGLAIRIGCHTGLVIEEDGQLFGDCVNLAARVTAMAKAGQIMASSDLAAALGAGERAGLRAVGEFHLKGKEQPVELYELLWSGPDDEATAVGTRTLLRQSSRLILTHPGGELQLNSAAMRPVILGRDAGCDIVVRHPKASRVHARIEARYGKFVLTDQSVNGTYVAIAGQDQLVLRREELILHDQGTIGFGQRPDDEGALRFQCR